MNFITEPELLLNQALPGCGRLVAGVILQTLKKWWSWIRLDIITFDEYTQMKDFLKALEISCPRSKP